MASSSSSNAASGSSSSANEVSSSSSNAASGSSSSANEVPSKSWEGWTEWEVPIGDPPSRNEAALDLGYRYAAGHEYRAESRARHAAYCAEKFGIGKPMDRSIKLQDVCVVFYEKTKMFRLVSFRTLGIRDEDFGDAVLEPVFTRPGTWEEFSAVPYMPGRSADDDDFLSGDLIGTQKEDGEEFRVFARFEVGLRPCHVFRACRGANMHFRDHAWDYYGNVLKTLKFVAAVTPKIILASENNFD